uniref:Uncharacterized protein n=1 Tax=Arundo donax TaxID=35708 RepID=A0A0A9HN87_ARUDO
MRTHKLSALRCSCPPVHTTRHSSHTTTQGLPQRQKPSTGLQASSSFIYPS